MRLPAQHRDMAIGKSPESHDLIGGPDADTAERSPEDVFADLAAEQEAAVRGCGFPTVQHIAGALRLQDVEAQMQATIDQECQAEVAAVDNRDPVPLKIRHARKFGRE